MELSETEMKIAEAYCHGLTDKEVALYLRMQVWTVRTHKKHIYRKLDISTAQELVLYMVARQFNVEFNAQTLHRIGLKHITGAYMPTIPNRHEQNEY